MAAFQDSNACFIFSAIGVHMEGRPERLADYFVVVGVGQSVTRFEAFPSEDVDFPKTNSDPITDIAVVFSRHETSPKGYR